MERSNFPTTSRLPRLSEPPAEIAITPPGRRRAWVWLALVMLILAAGSAVYCSLEKTRLVETYICTRCARQQERYTDLYLLRGTDEKLLRKPGGSRIVSPAALTRVVDPDNTCQHNWVPYDLPLLDVYNPGTCGYLVGAPLPANLLPDGTDGLTASLASVCIPDFQDSLEIYRGEIARREEAGEQFDLVQVGWCADRKLRFIRRVEDNVTTATYYDAKGGACVAASDVVSRLGGSPRSGERHWPIAYTCENELLEETLIKTKREERSAMRLRSP